jgi:hypothetical protein
MWDLSLLLNASFCNFLLFPGPLLRRTSSMLVGYILFHSPLFSTSFDKTPTWPTKNAKILCYSDTLSKSTYPYWIQVKYRFTHNLCVGRIWFIVERTLRTINIVPYGTNDAQHIRNKIRTQIHSIILCSRDFIYVLNSHIYFFYDLPQKLQKLRICLLHLSLKVFYLSFQYKRIISLCLYIYS